MSSKPLIGVSMSFHDFGDYGGVGFQRPIALAGGVPVILARVEDTLDDVLDVLDGVVIAGGRDIEPHRYGQEPHELLGDPDPHRDEFELELVRKTLEHGVPLLGMCRGIQVLNVALGGTLVQDIGNDDHWMREHTVRLTEGCKLARATGATTLEHCHSVHHQGLDRLASALVACGWAPDGQLEAVEMPSASWVVGAQWHPEDTATRQPTQQAIYDALVARAAGRLVDHDEEETR